MTFLFSSLLNDNSEQMLRDIFPAFHLLVPVSLGRFHFGVSSMVLPKMNMFPLQFPGFAMTISHGEKFHSFVNKKIRGHTQFPQATGSTTIA